MRRSAFFARLSLLSVALIAMLALASGTAFGQATIVIINNNAAGVGFNDPTVVAPVGGNTGTTLGQQRLNAFQAAANIWGGKLASNVPIRILASFIPLSCNATGAVLGSAGAVTIWANFPGVPPFPGAVAPNTWHSSALADKRQGAELDAVNPDIIAQFNVNLGNVGCLTGIGWYYGLDNNHGTQIDLVAVLLHEFAHGLGFQQFANVSTGAQPLNLTDVYGRQLLDTTTGLTWDMMTNAQRVASAINSRKVVWTGPTVNGEAPGVLTPGTPLLRVNAPVLIAGNYQVGSAAFGPPLSAGPITGDVVQALDPADGAGPLTTDACSALTNAAAIVGNIALVDRGTCAFAVKVKNAQNAGAIAVIVADNAAGSPPGGLGGTDPTITIPSVRITLADGITIKAQLGVGVNATLAVDPAVLAGADALGRLLMNAPNPVQPGSSISHWDPIASRNLLMEPAINGDLTHSVMSPEDLTLALMRDIGWFPDADLDGIADGVDCDPNTPQIAISAAPLPNGQAGIPYSQAISVTPSGSYSFSLALGSLPPGFTLHPTTGVLSGLATIPGSYNFTVKVVPPNQCSATKAYTLIIDCPVVTLLPAILPDGPKGVFYTQTLTATPAGGSYSFAVSLGSLPNGLTLNPGTGVLSGTPNANGVFNFTITATGFGSCTASRSYTVTIGSGAACPIVSLPMTLLNGRVGRLYSNTVMASPSGLYNYVVTSGALPPGVTLYKPIGLLFGYPTTVGMFSFTITAKDASGCMGMRMYMVNIAP